MALNVPFRTCVSFDNSSPWSRVHGSADAFTINLSLSVNLSPSLVMNVSTPPQEPHPEWENRTRTGISSHVFTGHFGGRPGS